MHDTASTHGWRESNEVIQVHGGGSRNRIDVARNPPYRKKLLQNRGFCSNPARSISFLFIISKELFSFFPSNFIRPWGRLHFPLTMIYLSCDFLFKKTGIILLITSGVEV